MSANQMNCNRPILSGKTLSQGSLLLNWKTPTYQDSLGRNKEFLPWLDWNLEKNLAYAPDLRQFFIVNIQYWQDEGGPRDCGPLNFAGFRALPIKFSYCVGDHAQNLWETWKMHSADVHSLLEELKFKPTITKQNHSLLEIGIKWALLWETILAHPEIVTNDKYRTELITVFFSTKREVDWIFYPGSITTGNEEVISAFLKERFPFDVWRELHEIYHNGYRVFDAWDKYSPFRDYIPFPVAGMESFEQDFLLECFKRVKNNYLDVSIDAKLWLQKWSGLGYPEN